MKKITAIILCCFLMLSFFCTVASASAPNEKITPRLNNVGLVNTTFAIVDGVAVVRLAYMGYQDITTYARVETKLQKRSFLFIWTTVKDWVDLSYVINWSVEHTYAVSSGNYRVRVKYEISGNGGATDVIEEELSDSY